MHWGEIERTLRASVDRRGQAETARGIGVSEGTLSRWLNTKTRPTGSTREALYRWAEEQAHGGAAPVEMPAQLYGQTIEVEALLRYVLARQEALRDTLKGAMDPMPLANAASAEARAKRRAPGR